VERQKKILDTYRKLVETRLGWGTAELWTNQEYERLSMRIRETTGRYIDTDTLKHIWRKRSTYQQTSPQTLNLLAKFMGYSGWHEFVLQSLAVRVETEHIEEHAAVRFLDRSVVIASVIIVIAAFCAAWLYFLG
jgi:hypothetical protein